VLILHKKSTEQSDFNSPKLCSENPACTQTGAKNQSGGEGAVRAAERKGREPIRPVLAETKDEGPRSMANNGGTDRSSLREVPKAGPRTTA